MGTDIRNIDADRAGFCFRVGARLFLARSCELHPQIFSPDVFCSLAFWQVAHRLTQSTRCTLSPATENLGLFLWLESRFPAASRFGTAQWLFLFRFGIARMTLCPTPVVQFAAAIV